MADYPDQNPILFIYLLSKILQTPEGEDIIKKLGIEDELESSLANLNRPLFEKIIDIPDWDNNEKLKN